MPVFTVLDPKIAIAARVDRHWDSGSTTPVAETRP